MKRQEENNNKSSTNGRTYKIKIEELNLTNQYLNDKIIELKNNINKNNNL